VQATVEGLCESLLEGCQERLGQPGQYPFRGLSPYQREIEESAWDFQRQRNALKNPHPSRQRPTKPPLEAFCHRDILGEVCGVLRKEWGAYRPHVLLARSSGHTLLRGCPFIHGPNPFIIPSCATS